MTRLSLRSLLHGLAAWLALSAIQPAHAADGRTVQRPSAEERDDAASWQLFKRRAAQSSDLRVRIAMSAPEPEIRDDRYVLGPNTALENLVELARGSTDPVVLWMLSARCSSVDADGRQRCDPIDMARRWTVADTQNQLAWLMLASALDLAGHPVEARDTLLRGAQASLWREYAFPLSRTIATAVPFTDMTPSHRAQVLTNVHAVGFSIVTPMQTLGKACRDHALHDACLRYLDVIARDADNVMALRVVTVYSARAGAPDDVVRARSERADALLYALSRMAQAADDASPEQALRDAQDRLAATEATRAARALEAAHLTEAEGARRFLAGLSQEQREYRSDRSRPSRVETTAAGPQVP